MTDTGQIPGEGLPENSGMVEQPGVSEQGGYTYLSETTAEDEDLLLPGAQSAWGNEVAPPAPEPVVETLHEPGPHELSGRDTGSVDLGGVRLPSPTPPVQVQPRRPLHLGPPIPDASASPVRSLADRGPAGAPVRHPGPATIGPEYLDVPPVREMQVPGNAPWVGPSPVQAPAAMVASPAATAAPVVEHPVAAPAEAPVVTHAEYPAAAQPVVEQSVAAQPVMEQPVVEQQPEPVGAAEAVMARIATETGVATAQADGPGRTDEPASGPEPTAAEAMTAEHGSGTGVVPGPTHGQAAGPAGNEGQVPDTAPVADAAQVPGAAEATEQGPVPAPESVVDPGQADAAAVAAQETVESVPAADTEDAGQVPAPSDAAAAEQAAEAVAAQATTAAQEIPQSPQTPESAPAVPAQAVPAQVVPEQAGPEQIAPEQAAPADAPAPEAAATVPGTEAVAAPQDVPAAEAVASEALQAPQLPQAAVPEDASAAAPVADPVAAVAAQPAGTPEAVAPAAGPESGVFAPLPSALDAMGLARPTADTPEPVGPAADPAPVHPGAAAQVPPAAEPAPGTADAPAADPGAEAGQDQPVGRFVPVEGMVPTTPHLAPTPPHPIVLPAQEPQAPSAQAPQAQPPGAQIPEPVAVVPAPREAEPAPGLAAEEAEDDAGVVQQAADLDTRGAVQEDQEEESTAAVEEAPESTGPAAPGFAEAEREAVLRVIRERRDIRNGFRNDPIPHEVLLRVLEAAHTAPSVGHSQPWDFVVIRSAETRRTMHELAMRQREAYAKSLPKGRAKQFREMKIEAILDTPVNVVVTADPTRGGRHTLGRHTQPQMAPYSAALAVENFWLAARAEGLGVGWVSFFDEREMVRALGLPDHLEVVAYLCVGYVDEFPEEPELMQAGWSKRRPLSWVVHEETYGRRALPGEDPHDLLAETVAGIRPLDAKALGEAWERQKRMTKPAGALGMLEIISAQLSGLSRQCPPPIPEPAAVAIFAGDHGVHAQGVTPWPQEVTAQMVANFLGGGAVCNAFAAQVGAEVCVIDVGVAADLPATPGLLPRKVRAGTSDMTTGPAMTREEAKQAIEVGIETARDLVAAGNKALLTGEMGIANTTASAALISVFTGADPAEVTGRGTGINDETLARKTDVVRRALEFHQPDPADPIGVLAAIGGFEHAAMVGLLLGGASLRTPVILDGVSAGAAALVARAIAPEVLAACIAGHRSAEPGHVAALNKLGLRPLVDLDLRLGEGTGALLALPLVQSTARAMHEVATFDSAGVTENLPP
ncbi:nicotinate-nucleotide--dimethylbenzimidazole phosphoribosyltransferase, partial [Streptomyces sp. NPDC059766]|uniref:nicotinate-nucleotide--dimethylbenzimidazole phosphoribosyltransferase n=1 Tax=Streptomyces sp. NPDC059766 TaxID=3346940 RepID=UPI003665D578